MMNIMEYPFFSIYQLFFQARPQNGNWGFVHLVADGKPQAEDGKVEEWWDVGAILPKRSQFRLVSDYDIWCR